MQPRTLAKRCASLLLVLVLVAPAGLGPAHALETDLLEDSEIPAPDRTLEQTVLEELEAFEARLEEVGFTVESLEGQWDAQAWQEWHAALTDLEQALSDVHQWWHDHTWTGTAQEWDLLAYTLWLAWEQVWDSYLVLMSTADQHVQHAQALMAQGGEDAAHLVALLEAEAEAAGEDAPFHHLYFSQGADATLEATMEQVQDGLTLVRDLHDQAEQDADAVRASFWEIVFDSLDTARGLAEAAAPVLRAVDQAASDVQSTTDDVADDGTELLEPHKHEMEEATEEERGSVWDLLYDDHGGGHNHDVSGPQHGATRQDALGDITKGAPTPHDLRDHPDHRAYISMDTNWGPTYQTFNAVSLSRPIGDIVDAQWALGDQNLTYVGQGAPSADEERPPYGFVVQNLRTLGGDSAPRQDIVAVQVTEPGIHFLTLTVTWEGPDGPVTDRVSTPLYVEETAIDHIARVPATQYYDPESDSVASRLLEGDVDGGVEHTVATAERTVDELLDPSLPTVMVVSDFMLDLDVLGRDGAGGVLNAASDFETYLGAAQDADVTGLTDVVHEEATTTLGHPVDHLGQTLIETLLGSAPVNVVFVRAIDPDTGALDRAALRNALELAQTEQVDSVLWGLPSAAYLPGLTKNQQRPNFAFSTTPQIGVPAEGALPYGEEGMLELAGYMDVKSVATALFELAFLIDHKLPSDTEYGGLIDALHANLDDVYAVYRDFVREVKRDLDFDRDLQEGLLDLAALGIPVVAPSEECADLPEEYMTVLGIGHLAGTFTVAPGTDEDGVDPEACKGPDRRPDNHGNGIDLFVDPRPVQHGLTGDLVGGTAVHEGQEVPFIPGSLGATLNAAVKLAELREELRQGATPWQSQDLVGMLVRHAEDDGEASPWAQGVGFVDLGSVPIQEPDVFPRSTQVVFSPFDHEAGRALGFLQVVVRGGQNVAAWEGASPSDFAVGGGTEYRFTATGPEGSEKSFEIIDESTVGRMEVVLENTSFRRLDPETGIATFVLSAHPNATVPGSAWEAAGVAPPSDWLFPGLYSGRTWVSTPNGVLQLPIHIGVGTIVDVHRFLHPDTPVGDTAVCLALPDLLGDLGLRRTSHELGTDKMCLYWTNTDEHGTARFYTPLPLIPYRLISWFHGEFEYQDGGKRGEIYPHIEEDIGSFPLPLNLTGITQWLLAAEDGVAEDLPAFLQDGEGNVSHFRIDTDPENPDHPVFVDGTLPHPLVHIPINITAPLAIAINWFYRDNMEGDHFLPFPDVGVAELLEALVGQPLPGTRSLVADAETAAAGRLRSGVDSLQGLAQSTYEDVKGPLPDEQLGANTTVLDNLLGQPLSKALPANLDLDPGACQWGYGHKDSPALSEDARSWLDDPGLIGGDPAALRQDIEDHLGREHTAPAESWPDTFTMRVRPTLDHLMGLSTNLPVCAGYYGFNIPQPNYYPTTVHHSFDYHLEATIMIVCLEAGKSKECRILVPLGDGTDAAIEIGVDDLPGLLPDGTDLDISTLMDTPKGRGQKEVDNAPDTLNGTVEYVNGTLGDVVGRLPEINVSLPDVPLTLTDEGRFSFTADLVSAGADNGRVSYVALPLFLLGSGVLDPVVGLLHDHGVNVTDLLVQELELDAPLDVDPAAGMAEDAVGELAYLLRDSAEDLLRIQPYVEIERGVLMLDAWWWDDFFIRAPLQRTPENNPLLPQAEDVQCVRSWADRSDPTLWRSADPADPSTLRFPRDTDDPNQDPTCTRHPVSGEPVVMGGTAARPDGAFDLAEDWWWLTFPNINRQMFERGLRYWDPVTLQPDQEALVADGHPWGQGTELFEVNMQMWNQHEIRSATPNQIHFHAAQGAPLFDHMSTNSAQHCTVHDRQDPASGSPTHLPPEDLLPPFDLGAPDGYTPDHPNATMDCMEGLLAFEEGNRWMLHNDTTGIGIYDPAMGLDSPKLFFLKIVDDLLAQVDGVNQALWTTQVDWNGVQLSPRQAVLDATGVDMADLQWWKRDPVPLANRTIYADLFTNSSFMLSSHHQTCEEIHLFRQLIGNYPLWKTACPVLPGAEAEAAWARAEELGVTPGWARGWVPDGWWDWEEAADVPTGQDPDHGVWGWDFRKVDPDAERTQGATADGWVALDTPPDGLAAAAAGQTWWFRPGIQCGPAAFEERWPAAAWQEADNTTRADTLIRYYDHLYGEGTVAQAHVEQVDPDRFRFSEDCGNYDGWRYHILADDGFNGGERPKHNAYAHIVQPIWHNGTFGKDLDAWVACKGGNGTGGWGCSASDPMEQVRDDLRGDLPSTLPAYAHRDEVVDFLDARIQASEGVTEERLVALRDLVANGTHQEWFDQALPFFGMEHRTPEGTVGQDRREHFVTVPLGHDPEGWFGGGDHTEWDAFYRHDALRAADGPRGPETDHAGQWAIMQDLMPVYAELLRAWLEGDTTELGDWFADHGGAAPAWLDAAMDGNPYWSDVAGQEVPYWELHRPRDMPGRGDCTGLQMMLGGHHMCMKTEMAFDAGDLGPFAGHWGRETKEKETYIPQGSAYTRWNRDRQLPVPYNVAGALAANDTAQAAFDIRGCDGQGAWQWSLETKLDMGSDGFVLSDGVWQRSTCEGEPTPWVFWAEHTPFHAAATRPEDPLADPTAAAAWGEEVLENYYAGAFLHNGRWLAADPNDRVTDHGALQGSVTDVSRFRLQDPATGRNADNVSAALYSTYRTDGRTFDGHAYQKECWGDVGGMPLVPYGSYRFVGGPPPFPTTFYDKTTVFGSYNHGATDGSGQGETDPEPGSEGPVPGKPVGYACLDEETGRFIPAQSEHEYIPQRLHYWMQGGYRHDERTLAPPRPFGLSGGMGMDCDIPVPGIDGSVDPVGSASAGGLCLSLDVFGLLPPLLEALLRDLLDIVDGELGAIELDQTLPHIQAPGRLPVSVSELSKEAEAALPAQVQELLASTKSDLSGLVNETLPDVEQAGPVVPLTRLGVAEDVAFSELAVHQTYDFPDGTQGVFVVSEDGGTSWRILPGRGTPGFTGTTPAGSVAFLETARLRGKEVVLGAQILGAGWRDASWNVGHMSGLPAGAPGMAVEGLPAWTGGASTVQKDGDRIDLADLATKSGAVVLDAPLHVKEGESLTLQDVTLLPDVSEACGGRHCPILVDGELRLEGGALRPMQGVDPDAPAAGQGLIVLVTGRLEATGVDIEGLVGGLPIPGGEVVLEDCWMRGNFMGPHVILGSLTMRRCVVDGPVIGLYALASHVRIEDNTFTRPVRTAGLFDSAWGVVRDNVVLHSKQSGFLVRDPLGMGNLALLDNTVEETGTGVGFHLALEDRLLPLDPLELLPDILPADVEVPVRTQVPLEARNRVQGNSFEWNTLEAMGAGALTAPAFYGNNATHNNIGAYPHLLSNATIRHNNLMGDTYAWRDGPALLRDPHHMPQPELEPRTRHPVADDGHTWAGLWHHGLREVHSLFAFTQLALRAGNGTELPVDVPGLDEVLDLGVDARSNHWGHGAVDFGPGPWPRDVVGDPALVDVSDASPVPVDRPALAMMTGPGYGGGILLDLETDHNGTRTVDLVQDVLATLPGSQVLQDGKGMGFAVPDLPLPLDNITIVDLAPRPAPVELDVPAGDVLEVRVRETYYRTELPSLEELLGGPVQGARLSDLVTELAPLLPSLLEPVEPRASTERTFLLDGAGSLRHEFTFEDILDAYVHWEVLEVRLSDEAHQRYENEAWFEGGEGNWVRADGVVSKDAVVYNSLVWPLITDMVLLAHNLVTGTLDEELLARAELAPGTPFALDPLGLEDLGLPVEALPDGVLPFDGGLSLLGGARDQDPVRWHEARLVFEADAEVLEEHGLPEVEELGSGFSMDRVLGLLPERLPEGVEARLEMRAMDASGLVSPWTGIRLLPDLRLPVPAVEAPPCITLANREDHGRVAYNATEPGFTDARRTSGLSGLGLHVTSVNLVDVRTNTTWGPADPLTEWDFAQREWTMPDSEKLFIDGAIHLVRAAARDRAGHTAHSETEVIVDLMAPQIRLDDTLADLKALIEALLAGETPYLGLDDALSVPGVVFDELNGTLTYALDFEIDDVPDEVDERIDEALGVGHCGLAQVGVQYQTEENGTWHDLVGPVSFDGEASTTSDDIEAMTGQDLEFDLTDFEGDWFNLRVHAQDKGGNHASAETGNVLVDLTPPVIDLPDLPICLPSTEPAQYSWSAKDPVPPGGEASGLLENATWLQLLGGPWSDWEDRQPIGDDGTAVVDLSDLAEALYDLRVRSMDRAGNVPDPLPKTSFLQEPGVPDIRPLGILDGLKTEHFIALAEAAPDMVLELAAEVLHGADECGLLAAVLEMSVDEGEWKELDAWQAGAGIEEDFDDGSADDWTLTGLWHVDSACQNAPSSPNYLGYHRSGACDYNTGARTSGSAVIAVDLSHATSAFLDFQHLFQVESGGSFDQMHVEARRAGGSWLPLASWDSGDGSSGGWQSTSLDLAGVVGGPAEVRFRFDSLDSFQNDHAGWYVDDVAVRPMGSKASLADTLDVKALEGSSVRFQVRAEDKAGDTDVWRTDNLKLIDLKDPIPKIPDLPDLPPCTAGDVAFEWGAEEGQPSTGEHSGLQRVKLVRQGPDDSWHLEGDSEHLEETPRRGPASWTGSVTLADLAGGGHVFAIDVVDHAGNDVNLTLYDLDVDTRAPGIVPKDLLAALDGVVYLGKPLHDLHNGLLKAVATDPAHTCGMLAALLEISTDNGDTWTEMDTTPGSPAKSSLTVQNDTLSTYHGQEVLLRVTAEDQIGHMGDWNLEQSVLVDLVAPEIELPGPLPNWIGQAGLTLDWSASDADAGMIDDGTWWKLHDAGVQVASGAPGQTVSLDGHHGSDLQLVFLAQDRADNVAETPEAGIGVDLNVPGALAEVPPCTTSPVDVAWSVTDGVSGLDEAWLDIRGGAYADWTEVDASGPIDGLLAWSGGLSIELPDGDYEVRVRALDVAGNLRVPEGADADFRVDTTLPIVDPEGLLEDIQDTPYLGGPLADLHDEVLVAAVDAGDAVCGIKKAVLELQVDGGAWEKRDLLEPEDTGTTTGVLNGSIDLTAREGSRILARVNVTDHAGNERTWKMVQAILVDLTGPKAALTGPFVDRSGPGVNVTWSAEDAAPQGDASGAANVTIERQTASGPSGPWTREDNWTRSMMDPAAFQDSTVSTGQYVRYSIVATDEAGNTGRPVDTGSVYVHYEAPTLHITEPAAVGRALFDVIDIGIVLPERVSLDLGDGGGATFMSDNARSDLPFDVDLSHPDKEMPYSVRLLVDGKEVDDLSGKGATSWAPVLDASTLSADARVPAVFQVTGANGLVSESSYDLYVSASGLEDLEESSSGWTGMDRTWGTGPGDEDSYLLTTGGGMTAFMAQREVDLPSPRFALDAHAKVTAASSATDLILLAAHADGAEVAALRVVGTDLVVRTAAGSSTLGPVEVDSWRHMQLFVRGPVVDVAVDHVHQGTFETGAWSGPIEAVSSGGTDGEVLLDGIGLTALAPRASIVQGYDPVDGASVWTQTGTGSVGTTPYQNAEVQEVVADGSTSNIRASTDLELAAGGHLSIYFQVEDPMRSTYVALLRDGNGDPAFTVRVASNKLYFSDGVDPDTGTARPQKTFDDPVAIHGTWHRLDLHREGSTVLVMLDEQHIGVGEMLLDDPVAVLELGGKGVHMHVDRPKTQTGPVLDATFADKSLTFARWSAFESDYDAPAASTMSWSAEPPANADELHSDSIEFDRTSSGSEEDKGLREQPGFVRIEGSSTSGERRMLHIPADATGDRFTVEGSFRLPSGSLPPDHAAALAGMELDGSTWSTDWAFSLAGAGTGYRLHVVQGSGTAAAIGPTFALDRDWHHVRLHVDRGAGTVHIWVDEVLIRKETCLDLDHFDQIAFGDVFTGDVSGTGGGTVEYDDVSILPASGPAPTRPAQCVNTASNRIHLK